MLRDACSGDRQQRGTLIMSKPSLLVVLSIATVAVAQPVYETSDRVGPVFSDLPSAGAREITLPQINLMDSPSPQVANQPAPVVAPYTAVQIMQPENGGTVHTNTGLFSMAVTLSPDLRTARGDAIAIRLDGTVLPVRRVTLQFDISPDEWQLAAKDQVEHQVEVAVVDRAGRALLIATPVHFYVHRATRR
jgi:hypothetical protein